MTDHKIITIGRQFGSGGHEIGNLLATRLDIPMYDNNLVRMAADKLVQMIEHPRVTLAEQIPVTGKLLEGGSVCSIE